MANMTERDRLAARFQKKAAAGLLDVKFFVRHDDEVTAETVYGEVNRLYDAIEEGRVRNPPEDSQRR